MCVDYSYLFAYGCWCSQYLGEEPGEFIDLESGDVLGWHKGAAQVLAVQLLAADAFGTVHHRSESQYRRIGTEALCCVQGINAMAVPTKCDWGVTGHEQWPCHSCWLLGGGFVLQCIANRRTAVGRRCLLVLQRGACEQWDAPGQPPEQLTRLTCRYRHGMEPVSVDVTPM